jgi:hypothetical protein
VKLLSYTIKILSLLLLAVLLKLSLAAQPATTPTPAMNTFVILFRQSTRTLSEAEKQRRAEETAVWARQQNAAGHKLIPHILGPESEHRGPQPPDTWPVTAILFLEAHDLAEAAQVAELHPALHYGSSVEVRPWSTPVPGAAPR